MSPTDIEETFTRLKYATFLCDSLGLDFAGWKARVLCLSGDALIHYDKVAEGKSVYMGLVKNAQEAGDKKREADYWQRYGSALSGPDRIFEAEAVAAFKKALSIFGVLKDPKGELDMCIDIARLHLYYANFALAESEYLDILKRSEALHSYQLPYTYHCLSIINRYTGNYNKSLGYALHTIKAMEETGDTARAGDYYGELAEIYQALEKPVESVAWYKKCIAKRELLAAYPLFNLYRTYSLLIGELIKTGAQKEALSTLKNLQKRRPPHTLGESAVLFQSMAYCYDADNVADSTEKYFLRTVDNYNKVYKKEDFSNEIVFLSLYDIAHFYIKHGQFKKARPYLDTIVSKSNAVKVSKMADVELLLFKVDSASGNYLAAVRHFQQYKTLTDSILNEKKSRQIEELQIAYKTEKKDKEIDLLTKKDQLQQANLRQANIIRNWVMASAALLILLLGVGYSRYRFKQKANKQLEEQQIVINQKNISLLHLVNEKEWLIKEIHHRVKNNFQIVMGLLGTQTGYLKNEEALAAIKESQQRIHSMSLIHQKLYQSENLSSIDMPGYIHELVDSLKESFDKSSGIQFHFNVDRIGMDLSHAMPIGLILNEAITNAFKYAFPDSRKGNIYISLTYNADDHRAELTVKDDGKGLPIGFDTSRQSSMGMNLMKGLSEDIDGIFAMKSNNGTIVTVSFIYNPDIAKNLTA